MSDNGKVSIRRVDDGWAVQRPAFGFSAPSVTIYPTWQQARDSLCNGCGTSAASFERSAAADGLAWGYRQYRWYRGPIRMDGDALHGQECQ